MALFLPILLMLLGGLVEFGFGLNRYINIVEAAREGARFGVDGDPTDRELIPATGNPAVLVANTACGVTTDYYANIACVVEQAAAPIQLDPGRDDIIITVARVYRDPLCDEPSPPPPDQCRAEILPDPDGLWPDDITGNPNNPTGNPEGCLCVGTAYHGHWTRYGGSPEGTKFDRAKIQSYIDSNSLSTGVLIVEVYYWYEQVLKLPWITLFVGDPANDYAILFYTYTIIPVPAGEPRPTPTITPTPTYTPTPTPTNTPTPTDTPTGTPPPTDTPTPTETPSPTETPTETPTPCTMLRADATQSQLNITTNNPAWADNAMLMQVQVILNDECGDPLPDRDVTLNTTRPLSDTITFNNAVNNQYFFNVRSNTVGASQFTAVVGRDFDGDPITIVIPLTSPPIGNFVSVSGQPDVSVNANSVQVAYTNPTAPSLNRRLVYLQVAWAGAGSPPGGLVVDRVSFGNSSNIIWQVAGGRPLPLTLNPADWTGINRSIVSGTTRTLQIFFNQPVTGAPGPYRIIAGWDNGSGGSRVDSLPVLVP
jgi:hypothetical protein